MELDSKSRLLIGTGRSGSTALLFCLAQSEQINALYQPIKTSVRIAIKHDSHFEDNFGENYAPYYKKSLGDTRFTIIKETIGSYSLAECDYSPFPRRDKDNAIRITRPIFLIRDPVEVFNAKKLRGWKSPIELSARAYQKVYEAYQYAKSVSDQVSCLTYEQLCSNPEQILRSICARWNIDYNDVMLNWVTKFPNGILGGDDFYNLCATGAFSGIENATTFNPRLKQEIVLDAETIQRITNGDLSYVYEYFNQMQFKAQKDYE